MNDDDKKRVDEVYAVDSPRVRTPEINKILEETVERMMDDAAILAEHKVNMAITIERDWKSEIASGFSGNALEVLGLIAVIKAKVLQVAGPGLGLEPASPFKVFSLGGPGGGLEGGGLDALAKALRLPPEVYGDNPTATDVTEQVQRPGSGRFSTNLDDDEA